VDWIQYEGGDDKEGYVRDVVGALLLEERALLSPPGVRQRRTQVGNRAGKEMARGRDKQVNILDPDSTIRARIKKKNLGMCFVGNDPVKKATKWMLAVEKT